MVFRRSKQAPQTETEPKKSANEQLKHPNPKILLIDMDGDVEATLKAEGYNTSTGSFGTPYRIKKGDGFTPVIANGQMPSDWAEQEIVVIDLEVGDILDKPAGEKHTSDGELDWWVSCSQGIVDPRPRTMVVVQRDFDRILYHGGVYIIFAAPHIQQQMILARIQSSGFDRGIRRHEDMPYDNWSFLSILMGLNTKYDKGKEISIADFLLEYPLGKCLLEQSGVSEFSCTLRPKWKTAEWVGLATNKYGDDIAGMMIPKKEEASEGNQGWIFVFPRIQDKSHFLLRFLGEILPGFAPHLFPYVEGLRWVQRSEYELPEIVSIEQEMLNLREETRQRIASLEQTIENLRADRGYLYDLLQATGRALVVAVQKVLNDLGFQSIIDVDAEAEATDDKSPKREDLQVYDDNSPVILVEVKGISQIPKDAAVLQVWKYIAPRMREWDRTDIRGLSIVNHQRHIPALERENVEPFREDLLTNAEEHKFGLLTTWDLFRLIRSFTKNNWKPEHVKPLFYQNGRIEPIPHHYEFIGSVEHFWPKAEAVGVRIEVASLNHGDRIAFELPVEFEEQIVESLQMDKEPIERVDPGQLAGIATHLAQEQARKGVRVFRVRE